MLNIFLKKNLDNGNNNCFPSMMFFLFVLKMIIYIVFLSQIQDEEEFFHFSKCSCNYNEMIIFIIFLRSNSRRRMFLSSKCCDYNDQIFQPLEYFFKHFFFV